MLRVVGPFRLSLGEAVPIGRAEPLRNHSQFVLKASRVAIERFQLWARPNQ